jgi:TolB-like protein
VQRTAAYAGTALAIAHAEELLAAAYDWPRIVARVVVTLLVLLTPLIATLAWYHGHKHLANFSAPEATIVALMIVLGAGVLILLVRTPTETGTGARPNTPESSRRGMATAARKDAAARSASSLPQVIAARGKPRLAIMPFENLSPDPANAFFTEGMHEEILTALTNASSALEVISRTTMMSFQGRPVTVEAVARELGVTHVLEGSVRRDGSDVRLTLQLIDARSDKHIWAQNYDRKLGKAMTLQSEVAREVASQLSVQLLGAGSDDAAATSDPLAYDLYLRAHLKRQLLTIDDPISAWRSTESLLSQAIEVDPTFALAYRERFALRNTMFILNFDARDEALSSMRTDLDMAEKLRPSESAWVASEATWAALDHQYARALALFSAAEAAGFLDSEAIQARVDVMGRMGLFRDALPLLDRALSLDPNNLLILSYRGIVLAYLRRPADALASLQLAIDRVPAYTTSGHALQRYIRWVFTADPKLSNGLTDNWDPQLGDQENALRAQLASFQNGVVPMSSWGLLIPQGVGGIPIRAFVEGELEFVYGRYAAAAVQGRTVLSFVATQKVSRHNDWFLKLLTAYARMYLLDKAGALAAARESLALTPRTADAVHAAIAGVALAPVLAWAGAQDEALTLLEQLITDVPGILPADLVHDRLYSDAFGDNARYQALVARLKAQIAVTKLD